MAGLIARDVKKIYPKPVFEEHQGYKAVDQVKPVPLLPAGIKIRQRLNALLNK